MRTKTTPRTPWRRMTLGVSLAGALLVGGAGAVGASSSHVVKAVVLDARESSYGTILASGNTLYALKPSSTNCAAACWSGRVAHARARAAVARTGRRREMREKVADKEFIEMPPAGSARRWESAAGMSLSPRDGDDEGAGS